MNRCLLAVLLLSSVAFAAEAPDQEGCKDSPLIQRFPGTRIDNCDDKEFDQYDMDVGDGANNVTQKKLEGRVQLWSYVGDPSKTPLQIGRNFENALKKSGAKILLQAGTSAPVEVTALFEKKNVYVNIMTNGSGGYTQRIVTLKAMDQVVEADASAMLDELKKSGHVAVYGINFDTGKASITAESGKVLEQVRKLLADNSDLKLRIEGHTDDVGAAKDNLALSKKRAAAVKAWLVQHHINGKRLTTDGFGSAKPVGDNKTDEGKAKNRRVELVKI